MSEGNFVRLMQIIGPSLAVGYRMGSVRSVDESLIPALRLHCLIRRLSGGSYIDICSQVQIHPSTVSNIIWDTMETK